MPEAEIVAKVGGSERPPHRWWQRVAVIAAVPILIAGGWFALRVAKTAGCRFHERRAGSAFLKFEGFTIDTEPLSSSSDVEIRFVDSPAESGTVLDASACNPSWFGPSQDGTMFLTVAR